MERVGERLFRRSKPILVGTLLLLAIAVIGVSRIVVNDNPVRWFRAGEPVRVADRVMNELFGGTYMAYVVAREHLRRRRGGPLRRSRR